MNLVTLMERDRMPIPHFWYLPRGEKAAVVMSGDDHSPVNAPGGTVSHFERYKTLSPAGCDVAKWECVRSTSYLYPSATITNAQAASYLTQGFERRAAPAVRRLPGVRPAAGRDGRAVGRPAADVGVQVHERAVPGVEPHALRGLAGLGVGGEDRARPRHPAGRQLLPLPPGLDRGQAGLPERRRLPDALRRPRRLADRRLPAEHEHGRRGRAGLPGDRRRAARQRGRAERLLRDVRREHAHRLPGAAPGRRGDRRPARSRAASR